MGEFQDEGGEELVEVCGAIKAADELSDLGGDGDAGLRDRVDDQDDAIGQRKEMDEIRTPETHGPSPGASRRFLLRAAEGAMKQVLVEGG
ncbi:MAG: hypothetical protein JO122_19395 [Acetobacteraceae bacterium]|nr:hypothetical protein [Acetobacteraceae bacterium]